MEPQVDVFRDHLVKTYANRPEVQLANVALAPDRGTSTLYRVALSDARWATGLSSFRREHLDAHMDNGWIQEQLAKEGIPFPEDRAGVIGTIQVPTMPLSDLLAEHDVQRIDVFCVDTEGYDYEILRQLDLNAFRPEVVIFESKNLSTEDYAHALNLFAPLDYRLFHDNGDTLLTRVPFNRSLGLIRGRSRRLAARCAKIIRGSGRGDQM